MNNGKTRNSLKGPERTKLTVWVAQNEKLINDNSDTDAADHAAKKLGFPVKATNIAYLRKDIYPDMPRQHVGSPLISMVNCIRAEVQALNERITTLEKSLGV